MNHATYTETGQDTDINWDDRACASYPNLFAADVLSYTPQGEEFAHLNEHEHAEMAVNREHAEAKAINICMGCPLLFACEKEVLKNEVYGVAAGMTAEERHALAPLSAITELDTHPRDRSWRNRINDEAVSVFTRQGWTNEQIANELECTSRTVARSRARMRDDLEPVPAEVVIAAVTYIPVNINLGKRVSKPMQAIYGILADGAFHDRDELIAAGINFVTDGEALAWFDRRHRADTTTPLAVRIAKGARATTDNRLSASARNQARTERDPNNSRMYRAKNRSMAEVVRTAA